jgi:hypothetical protein
VLRTFLYALRRKDSPKKARAEKLCDGKKSEKSVTGGVGVVSGFGVTGATDTTVERSCVANLYDESPSHCIRSLFP